MKVYGFVITPATLRGVRIVRALDLESRGHRFNSRLFFSHVATQGKLFTVDTHVPKVKLVPAKWWFATAIGKVTQSRGMITCFWVFELLISPFD